MFNGNSTNFRPVVGVKDILGTLLNLCKSFLFGCLPNQVTIILSIKIPASKKFN